MLERLARDKRPSYYENSSLMAVKSFVTLAPGVNFKYRQACWQKHSSLFYLIVNKERKKVL
jgi:hypothetical protein